MSKMTLRKPESMTLVTPTYAPDRELFADLHRSFLRFFPSSCEHVAIVPSTDLAMFQQFAGARCRLLSVDDVLPKRVVEVPRVNAWINLRRPVPPLRGWIVQQLLKLSADHLTNTDLIVLADSDVTFVRSVNVGDLCVDGLPRFYRVPGAIDGRLPRHTIWHQVARRLLGLPDEPAPFPDYVNSPMVWDRRVLSGALARVESETGRHWIDAIGSRLHFSEMILYGVYMEYFVQSSMDAQTSNSLVHSYFETAPLDLDSAERFLQQKRETDLAVMISAKSGTPLEVRRAALSRVLNQ